MKRPVGLILVSVLLQSCADFTLKGGRNYVIQEADPAAVRAVCRFNGRGLQNNLDIHACLYWKDGVAHIVVPKTIQKECFVRHELRHLNEGNWHVGNHSAECLGANYKTENEHDTYR